MLFEPANHSFGIGIVPITDNVALVDRSNRFQNLGMDAGVIIAGKTACGFHSLFKFSRVK